MVLRSRSPRLRLQISNAVGRHARGTPRSRHTRPLQYWRCGLSRSSQITLVYLFRSRTLLTDGLASRSRPYHSYAMNSLMVCPSRFSPIRAFARGASRPPPPPPRQTSPPARTQVRGRKHRKISATRKPSSHVRKRVRSFEYLPRA